MTQVRDKENRVPRCDGCLLPVVHCLCSRWTAAPCTIEITVIRHALEAHRASNTGRLVARCLHGANLIDYASPMVPFCTDTLDHPDSYVLYPQPGMKPPISTPRQIIVLDATWSQARRMNQRITALRGLPRIALVPPKVILPRMRRGQGPGQMSTAEAVVQTLRFFGETRAACHLETELIELVRCCALPNRKPRNSALAKSSTYDTSCQ